MLVYINRKWHTNSVRRTRFRLSEMDTRGTVREDPRSAWDKLLWKWWWIACLHILCVYNVLYSFTVKLFSAHRLAGILKCRLLCRMINLILSCANNCLHHNSFCALGTVAAMSAPKEGNRTAPRSFAHHDALSGRDLWGTVTGAVVPCACIALSFRHTRHYLNEWSHTRAQLSETWQLIN